MVFDVSERTETETSAQLDLDGVGVPEKISLHPAEPVTGYSFEEYKICVNLGLGQMNCYDLRDAVLEIDGQTIEIPDSTGNMSNSIFAFSPDGEQLLIALYDDGACILRAQENSKLPMQISFVANGINVALNLIFVWVLHLGVAGSSAATMIARAFAMVAVLYKLRNPKMKIQLRDYFSIRPEWEEIKRILHIGVPSGIENGMFQLGKLAIQST